MSAIRPVIRPCIRPAIRSVFRGSAFDPLSLFANGEQGAWYDPSDLTTLYQDAAGTTPVTADGDPVGLMLDASQKLKLGPELVTNGTFDADLGGWSFASPWQWSGGRAYSPYTTSYKELKQTFGERDSIKRVSLDYEIVTGALNIIYSDSTALNSAIVRVISQGVGSYSGITPSGYDTVGFARSAEVECYLDNISSKVLLGNHATQSASASKRLYRTDGTLHWLEDDLFDDAINANLPNLGTNATLAYADGSGVTILTGQTISGNTNLPTVAQTYGAIYLDRPFTASETENVTAYLNKLRGA